MARILFVNVVCYGSTGNICKSLYELAEKKGHTCCIAYGRGESPKGFNSIKIGNKLDIYKHVMYSRIFDACGLESRRATLEFINKIDEFKPDVIHMHNIHGYYINIEILFKYLKKHPKIKKIWTLHDCWSYTGHCAHYLEAKCNKWKQKCEQCQSKSEYPKTYKDNSEKNYILKRELFTGVANMKIVCVSNWLKGQLEQSFLKEYERCVITSGIDTSVFTYEIGNFKESYGISDRIMILGVANVWTEKKGLQDFIELRNRISDEYIIVLVGVNKKQINNLPKGIIGILRTENKKQMCQIYSEADIFFNPTKEETYGLTNLEAQACGTTTISYDAGGTRETIINKNAYLVENLDQMIELLKEISVDKQKNEKYFQQFDREYCIEKYLDLY